VVSDPIYNSTDGFGDGSCWWAEWELHWKTGAFLQLEEGSLDLPFKMCPNSFDFPQKIPSPLTTPCVDSARS
jgi:hypothetical protein